MPGALYDLRGARPGLCRVNRRGGVGEAQSPALGATKNGVLPHLSPLFSFFGAPKNGASLSPNAV